MCINTFFTVNSCQKNIIGKVLQHSHIGFVFNRLVKASAEKKTNRGKEGLGNVKCEQKHSAYVLAKLTKNISFKCLSVSNRCGIQNLLTHTRKKIENVTMGRKLDFSYLPFLPMINFCFFPLVFFLLLFTIACYPAQFGATQAYKFPWESLRNNEERNSFAVWKKEKK